MNLLTPLLSAQNPLWADALALEDGFSLLCEGDDIVGTPYRNLLLEGLGAYSAITPAGKYPNIGSLVVNGPLVDPGDSFDAATAPFVAVPTTTSLNGYKTPWSLYAPVKCFVLVYSAERFSARLNSVIQYGAGHQAYLASYGEWITVEPNAWTLIFDYIALPTTASAEVAFTVQIKNYEQVPILFHYPAIVWDDYPAYNKFAREAYFVLPEYMRDTDATVGGYAIADNPNPGTPFKPLFRLLEVMTHQLGELYDLREDFRSVPPDAVTDELSQQSSSLVDPLIAPVKYLRWLARSLGSDIYDPSSGALTWNVIESILGDWDGIEAIADWNALEAQVGGLIQYVDFLRKQIQGLWYGLNAGSLATLKEILEATYTIASGGSTLDADGFEYTFQGHYLGDPWKIGLLWQTQPSFAGLDYLEALRRSLGAGYELIEDLYVGNGLSISAHNATVSTA